ncbi:hypothetical protein ACN38_g772 [Penicillium nordicum]|uniref:Uncharacterized protein n=1 Tax=Penicillium nordicum TaxID=229535 RepID=A0A0M9WKD6_9EURO|nr:hypothetical protein ACN38_g772 [Penicillium nordicum]
MVKYNGLAKVWVDVYRCDCSALYYSSPHAAFCSLSKIEHALSTADIIRLLGGATYTTTHSSWIPFYTSQTLMVDFLPAGKIH